MRRFAGNWGWVRGDVSLEQAGGGDGDDGYAASLATEKECLEIIVVMEGKIRYHIS